MAVFAGPIQDLVDELGRLPGIGPRSAQRIAFYLLETDKESALRLAQAIAEVKDRTVIIVDDLISTGTTIMRAAKACREKGAQRIYVAASHGVFNTKANEVIADPVFDRVIITDSVPPFRLRADVLRDKLVVLESAALFAGAIERLHKGGSLVELLEV